MTFLVKVTHPAHNFSCSLEYAPREHEADTPEEAAQIFQIEAGSIRLDLCRVVERLLDGKELSWEDRTTGKTVVAFRVTHVVSVTYPRAEDPHGDRELKAGSIDKAAELVESECPDCSYDEVLESLEVSGRFEDVDEETGRIIVARGLAGAVV